MPRQRKVIALKKIGGEREIFFPGQHQRVCIGRLGLFDLLLEGPRAIIHVWVQRNFPTEDIILRCEVSPIVPLDVFAKWPHRAHAAVLEKLPGSFVEGRNFRGEERIAVRFPVSRLDKRRHREAADNFGPAGAQLAKPSHRPSFDKDDVLGFFLRRSSYLWAVGVEHQPYRSSAGIREKFSATNASSLFRLAHYFTAIQETTED